MTHQENKPTCGQHSINKTDNLVVSVIVIIKKKAKSLNQKIDYFRFTPGECFCVRALLHVDRGLLCARTEEPVRPQPAGPFTAPSHLQAGTRDQEL